MVAVHIGPGSRQAEHTPAPPERGLTLRRQVSAVILAVAGLPFLTWVGTKIATTPTSESIFLVYLLAVVVICVIGGLLPGLFAAVAAFLLANWFLIPPVRTFTVSSPAALADLVVFLLVAAIVSVTVEVGARNRARATRNRYETQLVHRLGGAEMRGVTPEEILDQVRELYSMRSVRLLDPTGQRTAVSVGPTPDGPPVLSIRVGETVRLLGHGPEPFAEDRLLLRALAEAAVRVWDRQELAAEAAKAEQLAETDRVRSALLRAVSHDLRTPIASIKTAASGLRNDHVRLSADDRAVLLGAIEDGADRLASLVDNLLAMSRIQAGALALNLEAVSVEEVVARATNRVDEHRVRVHTPADLPLVSADEALLERVVANVLENALRFSPPQEPVQVDAALVPGEPTCVELRVSDRGPGVAPERRDEMFQPFQRLGDTTTDGVGLGLAIARGLTEAMHGTITPTNSPGGGLTMVVRLPVIP